jgi:hypothetical protein
MSKGTGLALLYGLASAIPLLIALGTPGGVLFMLLVPLPLFLSGLSMGPSAAILSAATACFALSLMIVVSAAQITGSLSLALAEGVGMFLGTVISLGIPVVVLVRQALLSRKTADGSIEWYPPGPLVLWLTAVGLLLLVFSMLSFFLFAEGHLHPTDVGRPAAAAARGGGTAAAGSRRRCRADRPRRSTG